MRRGVLWSSIFAVGILALTACASAPAPAEVTTQTAKPELTPIPSPIPTPPTTAIAAAVLTPTPVDAAVSPSEPLATPSPSPSPSPSPQVAPTPTASPTTQTRIDEDGPAAMGQSAGCVSDPNPRLTALITDLSKIDFIDPTPVLSGNWLKNRSYLAIGRDTGGQAHDVPIYAPADSTLVGVTYYLQPMQDAQGAWVDVPQYDLNSRSHARSRMGSTTSSVWPTI